MTKLRVISYLAPSIPADYFALIARAIGEAAGAEVDLRFETAISGPLPGDDNPFGDGTADVGFVCAPTYRWLRSSLDLLPVPVPLDERAKGRPVYFADVIARVATTFDQMRGARWAFNDRNSKSGWFAMVERIAPADPSAFFSTLLQSGSHLESLRLVAAGEADAAAIDSNVLLRAGLEGVHVIESWGPFPIQPTVVRAELDPAMKQAIRAALLRLGSGDLRRFGFERFVDANDVAYAP